jgi:uncharacterized protein with von Willebrand factor type A (vWA) domain
VHAIELAGPSGLYWAGRLCLVKSQPHLAVYDRVFIEQFADLTNGGSRYRQTEIREERFGQDGEPDVDGEEVSASDAEQLRCQDFSTLDPEQEDEVWALICSLHVRLPSRETRRRRRSRRGRPDFRQTIRREVRARLSGPPEVLRSVRRTRPRRLVLVIDVSRSMAPYSRAMLVFSYALLRRALRVEVYCFSTRLTRVTDALRADDSAAALRAVSELTPDRGGGTRIGESLFALLADGRTRAATVVILSDGLEQGGVEELELTMPRLARTADQVIWVNPLKGDPDYQPLQRGMSAAQPYLDAFVSGHNLSSLGELAELLATLPH